MVKIELGNLGSVDVSKKFKANLNVTSEELFERFGNLAEDLTPQGKQIIQESIDTGREVKSKTSEDEITKFFEKIKALSGKYGVGEDELDELEPIEQEKTKQMDAGSSGSAAVDYDSGKVTIDKNTGKKEGKVLLGSQGKEGKVVPIKISENLKLYIEHDGSLSSKKAEAKGEISIENVSNKDRLWDIDLKLDNIGGTNLKEKAVSIKELAPETSEVVEYNVKADVKPALKIEEFISTINDPNVEFYALANNNVNDIYIALKIENITEDILKSIKIKKIIPEGISENKIISKSTGSTEISDIEEGKAIVWSIDEMKKGTKEKLEIKLTVQIDNKDTKLRSGKIFAEYIQGASLSGLKIDKFDAYSNNNFYIISYEMDEAPDKYECQFVFENKSDYMLKLVNADVYNIEDTSVKYVDIDPGEIPPLPAGAKWESNVWEYQTEGEYPQFKNKVEFFTVADHIIETNNSIEISDLELAVAAMEGTLSYNVTKLASYKVTPFDLTATVENTGGSDINEVILTENIQTKFKAPKPEEIKILINGEPIDVKREWVTVSPDDESSDRPHKVEVKLANLKDTDIGPLKPGDKITITYPIIADKPDTSSVYRADAKLIANTYPPGKPLEVKVDPIEIIVEHIRRKIVKGKDINALATEGEYEITLYVDNNGSHDLENYELHDKIPEGGKYSDLSAEPKVSKEGGVTMLTWVMDSVKPGDRAAVKYKLKVKGKASDVQDSEI